MYVPFFVSSRVNTSVVTLFIIALALVLYIPTSAWADAPAPPVSTATITQQDYFSERVSSCGGMKHILTRTSSDKKLRVKIYSKHSSKYKITTYCAKQYKLVSGDTSNHSAYLQKGANKDEHRTANRVMRIKFRVKDGGLTVFYQGVHNTSGGSVRVSLTST